MPDLKLELPSPKAPKTPEELGEFIAKTVKSVEVLAEYTRDGMAKVAGDIEDAHKSAREAHAKAAAAEELARNATRTAPGDLTDSALQTIPFMYNLDDDPLCKGKLAAGQYNLLRMTRADLDTLHEVPRRAVERFKYLHDTLAICDTVYQAGGGAAAQRYRDRGGMKSLPMWKEYESLSKRLDLVVSMDTAESSGGADWVPTGVAVTLLEDVIPEYDLLAQLETLPLPRSPYQWPVVGQPFRAYRVPEATSLGSGTAIGAKTVETLNLSFTAEMLAVLVGLSIQFEQDSIVPAIPQIRAALGRAINASKEAAWVKGQRTLVAASSYLDSDDTPGTSDDFYAWDGFRYYASLVSSTPADFSGGVTESVLRKMILTMGRYGKRPSEGVFLTGYAGYAALMGLKDGTGRSLLLTREVAQDAAVLPSGALAYLFGRPVVVTDFYSEKLNSSGVQDGTGSSTGLCLFNRRMFVHGEIPMVSIEESRERYFEYAQVVLRALYRAQGKPLRTPSSTYPTCVSATGIVIA